MGGRMDMGRFIAFQHYGTVWRNQRRAMHMRFHPKAVEAYHPIETRHIRYIF